MPLFQLSLVQHGPDATRSLYLRYDFSPVTVRYVETKDQNYPTGFHSSRNKSHKIHVGRLFVHASCLIGSSFLRW